MFALKLNINVCDTVYYGKHGITVDILNRFGFFLNTSFGE
jgi:hypothetical protein